MLVLPRLNAAPLLLEVVCCPLIVAPLMSYRTVSASVIPGAHQFCSPLWLALLLALPPLHAGFLTYLLPPVIFYAGISVEKERFFKNLPSILLFGVFGTIASFITISLLLYLVLGLTGVKLVDCLAMGAIFAATDSVATLQVGGACGSLVMAPR